MLKRILRLIGTGTCGERELSEKLGMEQSALTSALEELCMKGYLKIEGGACPGRGSSCAGCPSLEVGSSLGRIYALTEKGKKLIS